MKTKHLLFLCIVLFLTACKQEKRNECAQKIVVAYVTSWSDVMPDATYLTHINYAFGHVNEEFDGVRIENEERLKQIVALKKDASHLKVLLSVGGWGSGRFSEMAADETLRRSFAKDCQRVVHEFELDGIDIDWEYPTSSVANISASPDDTSNYTLLMRDIRQAIGEDKLLTQATAASAKYIDFRALDPYIDFTNIMAYDMGFAPYFNSPLYRSENVDQICADEAVKAHLEAGVPRHKLVMGLAFYGRGIEGFTRPKDPTTVHLTEGYIACWDSLAQVPYLTDSVGNMVYGYENLESLAIKCEYINANDLRGAMFWSYTGDNEAGDLRRTVYQTLNPVH